LGTNPDDGPLICNGITLPYSVLLASTMCDATPQDAPRLGDEKQLNGSSVCSDGGLEMEWNFVQQSE
jgi:hypothetical protein